ncbi:hypothetical protein A7Y00_13230 [Stenotrophomonas maltophilia]|nr:hypothetical protein A7Y00_13230 [Stenotrophomonas maltophilia]
MTSQQRWIMAIHMRAVGATIWTRITPLALTRYCIRQTRVSLEACSRPTSTWLHYRWPVKSMLCDF